MTSLAPHMEAFLREHLIRHRGASRHTCDSYAYSFQCLFEFASKKLKVAPSALMLEQKAPRSEEHTSELQSRFDLVCRLLLEKKKKQKIYKQSECARIKF